MSGRARLAKIMSKMGPRKSKPVEMAAAEKTKWNILRGDRVQVVGDHSERGKQGKVLQVLRKLDRVVVEGVHVVPKHIKGNSDRGIPGRTIQQERSIPYSNVNLVDPKSGKPTRVKRVYLEDGSKVRVAIKSGVIIPRPDILTVRKRPVRSDVTESCTAENDVWEITYNPEK
jgi:large subunit ribosomal protein L24